MLRHTDVLLPNSVELLAITGAAQLDDAAREVVELGCAVALKNGADGGILWTAQEMITRGFGGTAAQATHGDLPVNN